jgi:hypothetical protein
MRAHHFFASFWSSIAFLVMLLFGSTALAQDACDSSSSRQSLSDAPWYYRLYQASDPHCWFRYSKTEEKVSPDSPSSKKRPSGTKSSRVHKDSRSKTKLSSQNQNRGDRAGKRSDLSKAAQHKPANKLPFNPETRESLFRQFVEWHRKQSFLTLIDPPKNN